uniref:Uncharacterized protein n=1 Tax=Cacopsylla melanoneura TaxID=428564 RepID=A0A8D8S3V5_9HEMI
MRIVTGCLKPTPVEKLYPLTGIAPPHIRREAAANTERKKQETDPRHCLYQHQPVTRRLKSRRSFMSRTRVLETTQENNRLQAWNQEVQAPFDLREELAPGGEQPFTTWRSLNRLRTGVSRCKTNMHKWDLQLPDENLLCDCGAVQFPEHLLVCPNLQEPCTIQDLYLANKKALNVEFFWKHCVYLAGHGNE